MVYKCAKTVSKEISGLIAGNKVASVCCAENNIPYCFSCFYTFLEEEACIVFKSAENTKHIRILNDNNLIAGTIISSETSLTKVEGIQFEGVLAENDYINLKAVKSYYLRYPFAVAVPGRLWVIELNTIKYTNTTNGIKHKQEWERE